MVEAIQQMSTFMLKTMESLRKVASLMLQKILTLQNALISTSAEIVQEFKAKILITKETVGHSQDIKFGKSNNMDQLVEPKI